MKKIKPLLILKFILTGFVFFASLTLQGQDTTRSNQDQSETRYEKINVIFFGAATSQEVTVAIKDGKVYLADDMILCSEKEFEKKKLEKGNIIVGNRWEDGKIPYKLSTTHPRYQDILAAINHINIKTNICLEEYNGEIDFVEFVFIEFNDKGEEESCYSRVGKQPGGQKININNGCSAGGFGSVVHEICHTAGMFHEQQRLDRDSFIKIFDHNLNISKGSFDVNFGITGDTVGSYDYNSIMHYGEYAFANKDNPQQTIQVKIPPGTLTTKIGQRNGLSPGDIATIDTMYKVKHCERCPIPKNLSVPLVTAISAALTWSAISERGYRIEYRIKGTNTPWMATRSLDETITLNGLKDNTLYEAKIANICEDAQSIYNFSSIIEFWTKVKDEVCEIPGRDLISVKLSDFASVEFSLKFSIGILYCQIRKQGETEWTNNFSNLECGTTYEFRYSALCFYNSKFSDWSIPYTFSTSCYKPVGIEALNITNYGAKLSCYKINGVTAYDWQYRKVGSIEWIHLPETTGNFYNLEDPELGIATTYEFRVRMKCKNSWCTWSDAVNFSTLLTYCKIPTVVKNYQGFEIGVISVIADSYRWRYCIKNTDLCQDVRTIEDEIRLDKMPDINPNIAYTIKAKIDCYEIKEGRWSPEVDFIYYCHTPKDLTLTPIQGVNWMLVNINSSDPNVDGVKEAILEYRKKGDSDWVSLDGLTFIRIENLTPNIIYEFRARYRCIDNSYTDWTAIQEGMIGNGNGGGGTTCTATNLPTIFNIHSNSATISWNAVSNATSYRIEYKISSASTWTVFSTVTSNSVELTGLQPNTSYQVSVITNCSNNSSNPSAIATFTTANIINLCADFQFDPNPIDLGIYYPCDTRPYAAPVIGGKAPYQYKWSNASTEAFIPGSQSGTYTVKVTDANACSISKTITVPLVEKPIISLAVQKANGCSTNGGEITANVSRGKTPYTYQWSNGQTGTKIINLAPSNYSVTVTDDNNCTAMAQAELPLVEKLEVTTSTVPAGCTNAGRATAIAKGGLPPYQYRWSHGPSTSTVQNMAPGIYMLTVTDAQGCQATVQVVIGGSINNLQVNFTIKDLVCDNSKGSITTSVTGGTQPYSYKWSTGAITNSISNLAAGTYTLTVTSPNGCILVKSATVENTICVAVYDPVCGSDGKEYSNACAAACAGVSVVPGSCSSLCNAPATSVTQVTKNSAVINITLPSNSQGCELRLRKKGTANWNTPTTAIPAGVNSLTLSNLSSNTSYEYQLRVKCNANTTSDYSSIQEFRTQATTNLIAYYPFSGNANDASGNNLNGIVYDARLTTDRFGKPNSAYQFSGSNQYISVADNALLDIGIQDYTLSAWIKTSASNVGRIISKGSSGCSTGYMMRTGGSNGSKIHLENAALSSCKVNYFGNTTINDGQWHCVTGVVKRSGTASIYVDGNLDKQISINTANLDLSNTLNLTIGKSHVAGLPEWFNGAIDEVRLYSKALTVQEIIGICESSNGAGLNHPTSLPSANPYMRVYPNPLTANSTLKVEYFTPVSDHENVTIHITDLKGKSIFEQQESATKGLNKYSLFLSSIPKGVYIFHLRQGKQLFTEKIVFLK